MDVEEEFPDENQRYYFSISDVLFFNQYGFDKNCKILGGEESFLRELFDRGVKIVSVTLGKEGCRVITRDADIYEPAYEIDVVDPSGTGDTYNGAFLHGLIKGWSIERCTKFAVAAANYCVANFGPRSGAISEEEVHKFMRKHA